MGTKLCRNKQITNAHSRPILSKELLNKLKAITRMNNEEIYYWFNTFHKDCPNGLLTQKKFIQYYKQAFYDRNPTKFAKHIFNIFNIDKSGKIDFIEFLLAIDLFEKGNLNEKLRYVFKLYDIDHNGILTRTEIIRMIKMILSLSNETSNVQIEHAIISRLNNFFKIFDLNNDNKISLDEFCTICEQDEYLRNFLSYKFST